MNVIDNLLSISFRISKINYIIGLLFGSSILKYFALKGDFQVH